MRIRETARMLPTLRKIRETDLGDTGHYFRIDEKSPETGKAQGLVKINRIFKDNVTYKFPGIA